MSKVAKSDGYKIETETGDFWIDFSQGELIPEEETDDKDIAKRMEDLANSALPTMSDFYDLDKVVEISKNLTKENSIFKKQMIILLQAQQNTNTQLQNLITLMTPIENQQKQTTRGVPSYVG